MTLLELVVAIAASGIVLLGARLSFEQVADGADRVVRAARAADRASNGETLFNETLWNVRDLGPDTHDPGASALTGDARAVQFASWCSTPGGWTDPCSVALRLEDGNGGGTHVMLSRTAGLRAAQVSTVLTMPGRRRLLYLETAEDGGVWRSSWSQQDNAQAHLPRALGIAGEGDTLIARIGGPW